MTFTKLLAITAFVLLAILAALTIFQRSFFYPAPRAALDRAPPGFRLVDTRTSDGLTLRAAFRAPLPGKPTLLFFPGNADTAEGATHATRGPVAAGYGAMLVIYRGYSGNPGSPGEQGLYADGDAAMAWLMRQRIRPDQIIIVGNSIGSGPATEMAVRHDPAGLILVSGMASLPFVVSDLRPLLPASVMVRDRYDNVAKIAGVTAPILILHGRADPLVRPVNAKRLALAAPDATLLMVPGAGHDLAYTDTAQRAMTDWLTANFAAVGAAQYPRSE